MPRSITFFASIAEWKRDPEAIFVTALDGKALSELYDLVARADNGSTEASEGLAQLLRDKLRRTNEVNLDYTGVRNLAQLVQGVLKARCAGASAPAVSPIMAELLDDLNAAAAHISTAISDRDGRDHSLEQAKRHIQAAADVLSRP